MTITNQSINVKGILPGVTLDTLDLRSPYIINSTEIIENKKFNNLNLSDFKGCTPNIVFKNCEINNLSVYNKKRELKSIIFKNCEINDVCVHDTLGLLIIESSKISTINLEKRLIRVLIDNSNIINFLTTSSNFVRSIIFDTNKSLIHYAYFGQYHVNLFSDNSILEKVIFENSCLNRYTSSNTKFLRSEFRNSSINDLKDINLGKLSIFPISSLLLNHWGELSPELTALCMAYDAQNHPRPEMFEKWSKGGACPYIDTTTRRAVSFYEKRINFNPELLLKPINPYKLLDLIFAEKNIQAEWT